MDDVAQRRFVASMLVQALKALQPLLHSKANADAFKRSRLIPADLPEKEKLKIQAEASVVQAQYFEAVEALVWISSPHSDQYFDLLDLDPDVCRQKLDLGFYADLALTQYYENQEFMLRMYIAMARYSLQEKEKKSGAPKMPYVKIKKFAEEALAYTTLVLEEVRSTMPATGKGSKIPAVIAALTQLEEEPTTRRTA